MLQNACLLAKIGADRAENEQHFAEILPKFGNYPTGQEAQSEPELRGDLRASFDAALAAVADAAADEDRRELVISHFISAKSVWF